MTEQVTPTAEEQERAASRQAIADQEQRRLADAVLACGPDATAYGCWILVDKLTGARVEHFCCQRPTHRGWQPQPDAGNERLTPEQHPGFEIGGKTYYPLRFETHWQAIMDYRPQTAQQLADARARRAQRKLEALRREQKELLFPEIHDDQVAALDAQTR